MAVHGRHGCIYIVFDDGLIDLAVFLIALFVFFQLIGFHGAAGHQLEYKPVVKFQDDGVLHNRDDGSMKVCIRPCERPVIIQRVIPCLQRRMDLRQLDV